MSNELAKIHDLPLWKPDLEENEKRLPSYVNQIVTNANIKRFYILASKSREQMQEENPKLILNTFQDLSGPSLSDEQLSKVFCVQFRGSSLNGYTRGFRTIVLDQDPGAPNFNPSKCAQLVYNKTLETPSRDPKSEQPVSAPPPQQLPTRTPPASGPPENPTVVSAIPLAQRKLLEDERKPASDPLVRRSPPETLTVNVGHGSAEVALNTTGRHGSGELVTIFKEFKDELLDGLQVIADASLRTASATEKTAENTGRSAVAAEKTEIHTMKGAAAAERTARHMEEVADDAHETRDISRQLCKH